jgi:uncharacterized protein
LQPTPAGAPSASVTPNSARRLRRSTPGRRRTANRLPFNYRWEHIQCVVSLALHLAAKTGADREVVEAAAWLHDVCKGEPNHGAAGARAARTLLSHTDFPAAKIDA